MKLDQLFPFVDYIWRRPIWTVPASFKTAVVTPLIKKSSMDVNMLQNYRPICPLSQSCLNVLSALNYNCMSQLIFCFLQINQHIDVIIRPKLHYWRCTLISLVHLLPALIINPCLPFLTWLQRSILLITVFFCSVSNDGVCGNALNWFILYQSVRIRDKQYLHW